jgi:AcrR family transcriptional regulator
MFDTPAPTAAATGVGSPDRRSRRHEDTRREILAAAWDLCRENGLAGLSLRDLAARVGLRAPSLYSYVASKEAIYDALFAEGQQALAAHMAHLPVDVVTRDDLRAGIRAFTEFCLADAVRYQLMFQRTIPGFTPSDASYALAVANLDRMSRQLRAAGVTDPRHLDLWTAVTTGLIDQQIANDPGGTRWTSLVDEVVDMLCDHTGVPPTAPTGPHTTTRRTHR